LKLNIPIRGIDAEIRERNIVIQSNSPLRALTSSVLSRGYAKFMAILNHQIPIDYDHLEPKKRFFETIDALSLPKQTLGLMTAANIDKVSVVTEKHAELTVCTVATAGLTNPITAGDNAYETSQFHTINIILLIDGNLTQSCMVNAITTATEAKSAALRELDIRSHFSTKPATGTTSDMIAIACTERGRRIMFAGTATKIGELIGKSVKKAVKIAIMKQHDITPDRPLLRRLEERGIMLEDLLNSALELHNQHCKEENSEIVQAFEDQLKRALTDIRNSSLVLAGLRLNEDYLQNLIPEFTTKNHKKKLELLTASQTLGITIAKYLAGTKGEMAFFNFNEKKPGILGELEPIASNVIKGLLAGLSSETFN